MDYTNRYRLRGNTNSHKEYTMFNETRYMQKGNRYSELHNFPIATGFTRFSKSLAKKDSILTILLRMLRNLKMKFMTDQKRAYPAVLRIR